MKEKYDVVIIGAGVGGLTCGCYLAKAGLKVLIVEQHDKPGGYCTSFTRKGYRFDVGVHSLGGVKKGIIGKVFEELDLETVVKLRQFDPTDRVMLSDRDLTIRANPQETILEFKKQFLKETNNIDRFFKFVMQEDFFNIYRVIRKVTVKELLDSYFQGSEIKTIFNVFLRNLSIPVSEASALCFIILLREYVLDPGYYPVGGIQSFPDGLTEIFKSFGGEILFFKRANKIITENNKVSKVVLIDGVEILAKVVISNSDATHTFRELLDVSSKEKNKTNILKPSISGFAVYLGLKDVEEKVFNGFSTTWPFIDFDLNSQPFLNKDRIENKDFFITAISFPSAHDLAFFKKSDKMSVSIFSAAIYYGKKWWDERKEGISNSLIAETQKIYPFLDSHIDTKVIATPETFSRFTLNREGSLFGWASTVEQVKASFFPQKTSVKGLFLVGHWCTEGSGQGGVPKSVFSGRRGARLVMNELGVEWNYTEYIL